MSPLLIAASSAITAALVLYTIGVFSERRAGELKASHLIFFWLGLACDTTGTTIMSHIAQTSGATGFGIHAITGVLAIVLMLIHALWASFTYVRKDERMSRIFHTFSTAVWLVWLVPYVIGMLVGIPAIHLRNVCAVGTALVIAIALGVLLFGKDSGLLSKKSQRL